MKPQKFSLSRISLSITIAICILVSVVFWEIQSITINLLITIFIVFIFFIFQSKEFLLTFLLSFLSALIFAILIYNATINSNLFISEWQDERVSDSQYFLHIAQMVASGEWRYLFATWGSFFPVLLGAGSLSLFGGNFIGIIFLNVLLYTCSIFLIAKTLGVNKIKVLPAAGLLPLQAFYNGMLSKEPLFIFMIACVCYLIYSIHRERATVLKVIMLIFISSCLFLFRPVGLMIVIFAAMIFYRNILSFKRIIQIIAIVLAGIFIVVLFIEQTNYRIPLAILSDNGKLDFSGLIDIRNERITARGLTGAIVEFVTPPLSLLFSPLLSLAWLVGPLPNVVPLLLAFNASFEFSTIAIFVRYADSVAMISMLIYLVIRKRQAKAYVSTIIFYFLILYTIFIATFQFFDSARHRYLTGAIMIVLVSVVHSRPRKILNGSIISTLNAINYRLER